MRREGKEAGNTGVSSHRLSRIQVGHHRGRVPISSCLKPRHNSLNLSQFFLRQVDDCGIFSDPIRLAAAGDGDDLRHARTLRYIDDPADSDLAGAASLLLRQLFNLSDELEIFGEVLGEELRPMTAGVVLRDVVERLDLSAEEALAQRSYRSCQKVLQMGIRNSTYSMLVLEC